MSNLRSLEPNKVQTEQVVNLLENYLLDAKAGKFKNCLVVVQEVETTEIDWGVAGMLHHMELIGRLELLKVELIEVGRKQEEE